MQKAVRVATARLLGDLGAGGCRLSVSVAVAMRGVNRRSVSQSQRARADQQRPDDAIHSLDVGPEPSHGDGLPSGTPGHIPVRVSAAVRGAGRHIDR